jgi:hypothetical protein
MAFEKSRSKERGLKPKLSDDGFCMGVLGVHHYWIATGSPLDRQEFG